MARRLGFVNAMGLYNFRPEPIAEKLRRIDDIGGPDSHTNFPHRWAMASNTPLRGYKQNTHGGGIRDPFLMSWPKRVAAKGERRRQLIKIWWNEAEKHNVLPLDDRFGPRFANACCAPSRRPREPAQGSATTRC